MEFGFLSSRLIILAFFLAIGASDKVFSAEPSYHKQYGDWIVQIKTDAMTDEQICFARYMHDTNVFYSKNDVFNASYVQRGGVKSYRYRFGKATPSEIDFRRSYENDSLNVPVFHADALELKVLRIMGETVLQAPIDLEISLKGLIEARADMAERCDMNELPTIASGKNAWGVWQSRQAKPGD